MRGTRQGAAAIESSAPDWEPGSAPAEKCTALSQQGGTTHGKHQRSNGKTPDRDRIGDCLPRHRLPGSGLRGPLAPRSHRARHPGRARGAVGHLGPAPGRHRPARRRAVPGARRGRQPGQGHRRLRQPRAALHHRGVLDARHHAQDELGRAPHQRAHRLDRRQLAQARAGLHVRHHARVHGHVRRALHGAVPGLRAHHPQGRRCQAAAVEPGPLPHDRHPHRRRHRRHGPRRPAARSTSWP